MGSGKNWWTSASVGESETMNLGGGNQGVRAGAIREIGPSSEKKSRGKNSRADLKKDCSGIGGNRSKTPVLHSKGSVG